MAKTRDEFENDEPVPLPDIPPFDDGEDTPLPNVEMFDGQDRFEFIQLPPPFQFESSKLESPNPVESQDPFRDLPPIPPLDGDVDIRIPEAPFGPEWESPTFPLVSQMPAKAESSPPDGVGQKLDSVLGQITEALQKASTANPEQSVPDELAKQIETLNGLLRDMARPSPQDRPQEQPRDSEPPVSTVQGDSQRIGPDAIQQKMSDNIEVIRDTLLRVVAIMDS